MASSKIKQPSTNKPIEVSDFTKTTDSNGCITMSSFGYCASIVITSPMNVFAVRNGADTVKLFKTVWNGTYNRFVLGELEAGTSVTGSVIYF